MTEYTEKVPTVRATFSVKMGAARTNEINIQKFPSLEEKGIPRVPTPYKDKENRR
jgi:hypothetical protein